MTNNNWLFEYQYKSPNGSIISGQIRVKKIPDIQYRYNQCYRSYLYEFKNCLPNQDYLDKVAKKLHKKFILKSEIYDLAEDIEINLVLLIERENDYQAKIITLTNSPEEDCTFLYGLRQLPRIIEEELGIIHKIQNQPREAWIY